MDNYIKKGSIFHVNHAEFIALTDETETESAECKCIFTKGLWDKGELEYFRNYDLINYGPHPNRQQSDPINHPPHYGGGSNTYEAIKVIEAWELNFCLGNAVKYISRAGKKTASKTEDLKKAIWYLERELQNEKNV